MDHDHSAIHEISEDENLIIESFRLLDKERQEEELETAKRSIAKAAAKSKAA